jgi:hypothetical protein
MGLGGGVGLPFCMGSIWLWEPSANSPDFVVEAFAGTIVKAKITANSGKVKSSFFIVILDSSPTVCLMFF